jgi:hypothetical protein
VCHPARDIARLFADVVMPGAGREGFELGAQIGGRSVLQNRNSLPITTCHSGGSNLGLRWRAAIIPSQEGAF